MTGKVGMAIKEDLSHFATKEDFKDFELCIVKWMIGVAGAIIGILFALLRFIPPGS